MKGLACALCMDLRALPQGDLIPVSCRCGNVEAWWVDGGRGVARFDARDRGAAFALGLCNTYLIAAMVQPLEGVSNEEWRKLHDDATDAPGYLFDKSNRACWALIFRPGTSSDTGWATPQEYTAVHPITTKATPAINHPPVDDREPQPSDGPDYHHDHRAWATRQSGHTP